jgi:muramidase (phage lysozyme)
MIRVGEGTADPDGYRRHFGGRLFDDYSDHPRIAITAGLGKNKYTSTAAGAYQFLSRTWDECAKAMHLVDFSPPNQDKAAEFLIARRKALDDVLAGRIESAIAKCALEWASLPGSPYGQPVKTLAQAMESYREAGGVLRPSNTPAPIETRKEAEMPLRAFVAAALPSIISSIPALGKLFGSGSDVAERNVKAAELAVQIVQQATGAKNAQEAAEAVADPVLAKAATEAVQARWHELTEAGGGGIDGARKADAAASERRDMLYSPSFWVALPLLIIVIMIVGAVVGLWGTPFSEDVRSAIANGIPMLILGGLIGYYYGQTTSRNRTP